jgi:acyl-CoA synthetase (AMP-forming)/AMP-acid ligase II
MVIRSGGGGLSMNAAALLHRVHIATVALEREGVGRGDLVLLAGLSGLHFAVAVMAVWSRDAAAVAADAQLAPGEVEDLRATFGPRAAVRPGAGSELQVESLCAPASHHDPTHRHERGFELPEGAAVIKLTSGSTGRPRGIAATASQLLADARHISEGMGVGPDDVCVGAIPLSHSYGLSSLLLQLVLQGSPLLLVPGSLPELLAEALSIEEPAIFPGVPYLFEMLARAGGPVVRRRGLKTCLSAAAPLRAATAMAFRDKVGLPVRSFYGTSETGGITYDASPEGDAAVQSEGCVGTPLPGVRVTLEGDEGRVVVSGDNITSGYLGAPGEPRDGEFHLGAFHSGDTGSIDERGRLHLIGRISSLVNVSGRKVNPREIERHIAGMSGVSDAAVLGVSDGVRGQALVAFIVKGPGSAGLTRETVMSRLKDSLAPYKTPRRIIFMGDLPRSPRGKLDHETLRRLAMEEVEGA